ncbi:MAG: cbb3-type cytochrome oxidase assembly protein CcoS [Rhodocyclaceae bacterium]|nr:cbb3-type cytochrome oxidase assembly protein CcoS [Rhodocyclaceae bacterium]
MESLYLLIPVSIVLVFAIGAIFWWSLKSGQMEDLEGPAYRILMDDDRPQDTDALAPKDGKRTSFDPDQSP